MSALLCEGCGKHLTTQQCDIIGALQDGVELTTLTCFHALGITALSQRGGELERMGLVVRDHPEVLNRHGKPVKVCRVTLTAAGRALDLDAPGSAAPVSGATGPTPPEPPEVRQPPATLATKAADSLF